MSREIDGEFMNYEFSLKFFQLIFVRYIVGIVSIACGPKISEKAPGWLKVGSKFLFFAFLLRNSYMLK